MFTKFRLIFCVNNKIQFYRIIKELIFITNFMTVKETAEYLNVPVAQIYKLCKKRSFPAVKIGKHIRIHKDKLDAYFYAG